MLAFITVIGNEEHYQDGDCVIKVYKGGRGVYVVHGTVWCCSLSIIRGLKSSGSKQVWVVHGERALIVPCTSKGLYDHDHMALFKL